MQIQVQSGVDNIRCYKSICQMKNYILFFLVLMLCACNQSSQVDRYAHLDDTIVKTIVKKAINHAGGIDKWESIKRLRYTKDFALLSATGEVEKTFKQVHDYQYRDSDKSDRIDIKSTENGDLIHTVYAKYEYSRTKNEDWLKIDQETLEKAVNTSLYVVGMPFKLLDEGAKITYEGETNLKDIGLVDVLRVEYDADKHDNHSTSDIWKYYFDKKDGKIVANWVQSSDHANIVENLSFERVGGILFNKKRKSYRLDSLGNKDYVRADYDYGNYQVEY